MSAFSDEQIFVVGLTCPRIAETGRVPDTDKAVNLTIDVFMSAESVVTAFDRGDVLIDEISLRSVDVEPVVVDVRPRDIFHRKP